MCPPLVIYSCCPCVHHLSHSLAVPASTTCHTVLLSLHPPLVTQSCCLCVHHLSHSLAVHVSTIFHTVLLCPPLVTQSCCLCPPLVTQSCCLCPPLVTQSCCPCIHHLLHSLAVHVSTTCHIVLLSMCPPFFTQSCCVHHLSHSLAVCVHHLSHSLAVCVHHLSYNLSLQNIVCFRHYPAALSPMFSILSCTSQKGTSMMMTGVIMRRITGRW